MYYKYYVNSRAQSTGEHEVHKEGCVWLRLMESPVYLGVHFNCEDAVNAAKRYYKDVDGCATCCSPCHTK